MSNTRAIAVKGAKGRHQVAFSCEEPFFRSHEDFKKMSYKAPLRPLFETLQTIFIRMGSAVLTILIQIQKVTL
jgi:hypothetical protein